MMIIAHNHSIQEWINHAIISGRSLYILNLKNLIKKYLKYIRLNMKHIVSQIRSLWWTLKTITKISSLNKKKETKIHKLRLCQIPTHDLIIYTNNSNHDGHIEMTIYSLIPNMILKQYIEIEDIHNIYAMKLMIIQMVVSIFKKKIKEHNNVYIFTDNQSAIQTIESSKWQFNQYIIKEILNIIDRLYTIKSICNIYIEWISEYQNIEGNEQMNEAAKAAVNPNNMIFSIRMKSPQKTTIRMAMKMDWEIE